MLNVGLLFLKGGLYFVVLFWLYILIFNSDRVHKKQRKNRAFSIRIH